MATQVQDESIAEDVPQQSGERGTRRKIPGNLPYTTSPGVLRQALDKIPVCAKPGVFNTDFVNKVLGLTGGASRPIVPILKSVGFLSQSGTPTDLYSRFQTQSDRANAALQALKNGFSELFKRNQYANRADENALTDLIVSATGLPRTDAIVRAIRTTFQTFQDFASGAVEEAIEQTPEPNPLQEQRSRATGLSNHGLGLTYNINIVLPETTSIEVYNSIFRSLKENLLS